MTSKANTPSLLVRSRLMSAIKVRVVSWQLSQGAAAARLGIGRPRLNDLLQGKTERFSLDALVNLAVASGLAVNFLLNEAA